MSMKKAQSAMEYLMTYGWAILIVIIVAAALYALGIFNPATYTGRIPTGFTTLGSPSDWDVDSNGYVDIILNNRLPNQINVLNVTVSIGSDLSYNDTEFTMAPGTTIQYTYAVSGLDLQSKTAGTTYSMDVEVTYNQGAGSLNHTETGVLSGTISN